MCEELKKKKRRVKNEGERRNQDEIRVSGSIHKRRRSGSKERKRIRERGGKRIKLYDFILMLMG